MKMCRNFIKVMCPALVLALVCTGLLAACQSGISKKKPMSGDEFREKIEALGYEITADQRPQDEKQRLQAELQSPEGEQQLQEEQQPQLAEEQLQPQEEKNPILRVIVGDKLENAHMEFYECDSHETAAGMLSSNKEIVKERQKENSPSELFEESQSYQKFTLKTADIYYILVQVDSTFLNVTAYAERAQDLDEIVKKMGY